MDTAIVVFTRDLRLHDNPALHQACARARQVLPLFVADPAIAAPPNRARFLAESLADLRACITWPSVLGSTPRSSNWRMIARWGLMYGYAPPAVCPSAHAAAPSQSAIDGESATSLRAVLPTASA
jgi:hypothetical protein